ncbi:MAG: hypothetical protein QW123_00385 [Desulfurococcaceae archaeon]
MKAKSIVFSTATRIIPLILFWELLSTPLEKGLAIIVEASTLLRAGIAQAVSAFAFYASLFSAILTVATGSPLLYTVTLTSILVYKQNISIKTVVIGATGLIALIVLDTIRTVYREGQSESINYGSLSKILLGLILCTSAILLLALTGVLGGVFTTSLITSMSTLHGLPSLLADHIVFRSVLVIIVVIFLHRVLSNLLEVVSVFALPSKSIAIKTLSSTTDIDVMFRAPLDLLKVIIITSFIAPLIYTVLLDHIIPATVSSLRSFIPGAALHFFSEYWFRFLIALIVFILSWRIINRITSFYEKIELKGVLIALVVLLSLIYAVGVYYQYGATGDLVSALFNPNLEIFDSEARRVYIGYYVNFIYFFETISVLAGFAP